MKIAVIGLGSMGKRRIRLLKKFDKKIDIIGVDTNQQRCVSVKNEYDILTVNSLDQLYKNEKIDATFICTSPLSHNEITKTALMNMSHVFSEINLVPNGYEKNIELAKKNNLVLFLSSTPLYRKEIEYIGGQVNESEKPLNYIYHVGQHLSDWHPWENYKDFFVGDIRTNGCREILCIELPWMINAFGKITDIKSTSGNMTSLDIEYPDYYSVMFSHDSGINGVFCVDIASRKAVRRFELYGEALYIKWNGTSDSLYRYCEDTKSDENISLYDEVDSLSGYNETIIEDAYYLEIKTFIEMIHGKGEPRHTFQDDLTVIGIANKIEKDIKCE